MSGVTIDNIRLFGTAFRNVVLPVEGDSNYDPEQNYAPVRFENCKLAGAILTGSDLSNVEISDCNIKGLKINGILIEELLLR